VIFTCWGSMSLTGPSEVPSSKCLVVIKCYETSKIGGYDKADLVDK